MGGGLPLGLFGREFKQLRVCRGPLDHGCVIGWDAVPETFAQRHRSHFYYSEAGRMHYSVREGKYVVIHDEPCLAVSPLTWKPATQDDDQQQEGGQDKAEHLGVLEVVWGFSWWGLRFLINALLPARKLDEHFKVMVEGDYVVVGEVSRHVPKGQRMSPAYSIKMFGGTYHLQDYSLFYFNIRHNAKARIQAFLDKRAHKAT